MERLTSPPPQVGPGGGDGTPAVSPNGRMLSFMRTRDFISDLFVQPVTGGAPRLLVKGAVNTSSYTGQTWITNEEIVFSHGSYKSYALWRVAVDGRKEPEPVLGALAGAVFPTLAHTSNGSARLAYAAEGFDTNIWRLEIATEAADRFRVVTEPRVIIASTRADTSPQFSPDGRRIAFESDRDGYREIWAARSDGSDQVKLTAFKSLRSGSPKWSPDGRQIVFDSLVSGTNNIWIIGSEGGPPRQVTTELTNQARPFWSHDGRWIYFRSDRSGAQQIWRVPASEPFKPAVQITKNGAVEAMESYDGKSLYYILSSQGGLWSMPVEGGEEVPLIPPVVPGFWTVARAGLLFFDVAHTSADAGTPLEFFSFATRNVSPIRAIPRVLRLSPMTSPSIAVTEDGRWIAWTQVDHQDSDLMLIENFR
jgi:Tol biopolymer transport system component